MTAHFLAADAKKLTEEKIGLRRHFGPAIDDQRLQLLSGESNQVGPSAQKT